MLLVPVIVVFTKYDLLIRKLEREATDDVDDEELEIIAHKKADAIFNETCVQKLTEIIANHGRTRSYVKVSSTWMLPRRGAQLTYGVEKPQYHDTLVQLVDETKSRLDERMSILWAMVQRASVDEKINACIAYVNFIQIKHWILIRMLRVGRRSASASHVPRGSRLKYVVRVLERIVVQSSLPQ